MSDQVTISRAALGALLDYIAPSERADYERQDPAGREGHVYPLICELRAWRPPAPTCARGCGARASRSMVAEARASLEGSVQHVTSAIRKGKVRP